MFAKSLFENFIRAAAVTNRRGLGRLDEEKMQIKFFWIISPGNGWLMLQRLAETRRRSRSPVSPTFSSSPQYLSADGTVSESGENSANSGEMSRDQKQEGDGTMVYANKESLTPLLGYNTRLRA
jgi:hypothetical protein